MILNIDMLCTSMMLRIVCECYSALIVGVNDVLIADIVVDFSEKSKKPNLLLESMEKDHVFRFRDGEND